MKLPGRNDPCLCGSGKKFKQCCIESYRSKPADWHPAPVPVRTVNNWNAYQYIGSWRLRDTVMCMRCQKKFVFGDAVFKSNDNGKHQIHCKHFPDCEGTLVEFLLPDSECLGSESDVEAENYMEN